MMRLAEREDGLLLIRYQQPQNRVVANTSLANEDCGIGFAQVSIRRDKESSAATDSPDRLTEWARFPRRVGPTRPTR